ncbi:DUF3341 domain-containing protein [Tundrisphaera lichenicola]|uniref:DUF3341 domain-containing protein n=1 Tax=Tundrisphaera lichenicola TaxID=2029860 RepID=UPI003EB8BCC6
MTTHAHEEIEVGIYGLLVEFLTPEALLEAARKVSEAGYKKVDAYSPFPVHGVAEAIGAKTILPWLIFGGGVFGAINGFGMQMFGSTIHYPINIAGKPNTIDTWPSFMPVTFELTVLFAAATAVFGMLFLNGLPRPYNPLFNVPEFAKASQDRFFLCIQADDPKFDHDQTSRFLEGLEPTSISEVPF